MARYMRLMLENSNVIRRLPNLSANDGRRVKSLVQQSFLVMQRRYLSVTPVRPQAQEETEVLEQEEVVQTVHRPLHDVATSKRYMQSKAYRITYGDKPVWVPYRRNHKGQIPPEKTRKTCIRGGEISTGNPCPICRDEYLVLDPEHPDLLNQFISKHTGEVLSFQKTGICQKQHKALLIAVEKAWDIGTVEKPVPFREYDYGDYYPQLKTKNSTTTHES